jgi:hypothetical protein
MRCLGDPDRKLNFGFLPMILLLLLGFGQAAVLTAQDEDPKDEPEAQEMSEEEHIGPKITFHGFLSQAYAASDGHQILGITGDGTADYRSAALQLRADLTPQDAFVVQFAHERIGASPLGGFREEIELDWLFYEHKFESSAIKVGRVQIPFGIYNEVRDAGTVLPFYRPSTAVYGESFFSSETVDGIVLHHRFKPFGAWGLTADIHYGDWEFTAVDQVGYFISDVRNSVGVELWLETPLPGLRIGTGAMRYETPEARQPGAEYDHRTNYHVSVAGEFSRFVANAEFTKSSFPLGHFWGGYVHLGFALTNKIVINGQYGLADLEVSDLFHVDLIDNTTLGVNYRFRPDLVLKAEHHWDEGFTAEAPLPNLFAGIPMKTRFWMLSLSTSF